MTPACGVRRFALGRVSVRAARLRAGGARRATRRVPNAIALTTGEASVLYAMRCAPSTASLIVRPSRRGGRRDRPRSSPRAPRRAHRRAARSLPRAGCRPWRAASRSVRDEEHEHVASDARRGSRRASRRRPRARHSCRHRRHRPLRRRFVAAGVRLRFVARLGAVPARPVEPLPGQLGGQVLLRHPPSGAS